MRGVVLLDSNILVLLAVGATSRNYISVHKNTKDHFNPDDFDLVGLLIGEFSDILKQRRLLPTCDDQKNTARTKR